MGVAAEAAEVMTKTGKSQMEDNQTDVQLGGAPSACGSYCKFGLIYIYMEYSLLDSDDLFGN